MSISKTQRDLKEEEIIQELLRNGVEPNVFEVSNKVSGYFSNKVAGLPYFTPKKIKPHSTSDPKEWDQMFKNLNTDLDIIYRTNVEQNNKLITMEEYYLAEKEKIASQLEVLQLRLSCVQDVIATGNIAQSYCQTFDNFYNIEFDGDSNRNIPYTTSVVDLLQSKVYSDKLSRAKDKQDITASSIKLTPLTNHLSAEVSGTTEYIFKDTLNEFYIYNVKSNVNSVFSIKADVTFPDVKTISSVVLTMTSSKTITGMLSISEDGFNYTDLYEISKDSVMEWNFDSTNVKHLKIILSKPEADGYDQDLFEYYFILKNISAINETFIDHSTFVSKPIVFNDIIDTVTVKANDLIFPHTSINYFIGLDDGSNKINWQFADNGVPLDLNLLESKTKIINSGISGYGKSVGNGCYRICKAPAHVNLNSLELRPGYQMWHAESIDLYALNRSAAFYPSTYSLNANDYMKSNANQSGTIDNEEYRLSIKTGHMHVLTQYVFTDEDTMLTSKYIRYGAISGNDTKLQSKLYINNNIIAPSSSNNSGATYDIRLKKGRNKVMIILFSNTKDNTGYASSYVNIEHNINFKECTFNVFTAPKMKLINYPALQYRVTQSNDKYFSIDDEGYIVVKYNPFISYTAIKTSTPNGTYDVQERQMRYLLNYKALSVKGAKKIKFMNDTPVVTFRLMATFLSAKEDISPQLLSYGLLGQ